jgi:hypothetical protein
MAPSTWNPPPCPPSVPLETIAQSDRTIVDFVPRLSAHPLALRRHLGVDNLLPSSWEIGEFHLLASTQQFKFKGFPCNDPPPLGPVLTAASSGDGGTDAWVLSYRGEGLCLDQITSQGERTQHCLSLPSDLDLSELYSIQQPGNIKVALPDFSKSVLFDMDTATLILHAKRGFYIVYF